MNQSTPDGWFYFGLTITLISLLIAIGGTAVVMLVGLLKKYGADIAELKTTTTVMAKHQDVQDEKIGVLQDRVFEVKYNKPSQPPGYAGQGWGE